MPLYLMMALFLAFGAESFAMPELVGSLGVGTRVAAVAGWAATVALVARLVSWGVAVRCARGGAGPDPRRLLRWGGRLVDATTLGGYAGAILVLGWPEVVRSSWGWRDSILVDEVLILLPFLANEVAGWWGLAAGDRAIRARSVAVILGGGSPPSTLGYVVRRARQAFGMVLPSTLIFATGQDLARWLAPGSAGRPDVQLALMVGMGGIVLALAPAFVRLSWPTHPLPAGPLRSRLERVARRFGFRCSQILVWETDGAVVNAGVTGATPFFRYVLLSDALIAGLNEHEVAAVFGHEVGHARHRHLAFFGLFFIGSVGVLALVGAQVDEGTIRAALPAGLAGSWAAPVQGGAMLGLALAYFGVVFGHLSRRFERQADVFGARVVSCGAASCPPHPDPDAPGSDPADRPPVATGSICPVGLRTFSNALRAVARLNEIDPAARSWRHGSIARRIAFLATLEDRPDAERHFQASVRRLRVALVVVLGLALALAFHTGAIEQLGL